MLSAQKELKEATSKTQEDIINQKYKDAAERKQIALIKRERAYAKEEKSEETGEISATMDADKPEYTGDAPEEYYEAVTKNAVQNLEQAIKTENQMKDRLEQAEDDEQAIDYK